MTLNDRLPRGSRTMAKARQQSSTNWRLLAVTICIATALLPLPGARAEIILDDFDESFQYGLPEMIRQYDTQPVVGPLGVERRIYVNVTSAARPIGQVDANLSNASALTAKIDRINPDPIGGAPSMGINLLYSFDEMDVTQGGINDRIVLDVAHLESAIPLARVDFFIQDAAESGVSYVSQQFNISPQDLPFRIEFPLDSFRRRDGGSGHIKYDRVFHASLSISPIRFTNVDEIDFSIGIERIRFSNAIPEPGTGILACFAASAGFLFFMRGRRMELCATGESPRYWQGYSC